MMVERMYEVETCGARAKSAKTKLIKLPLMLEWKASMKKQIQILGREEKRMVSSQSGKECKKASKRASKQASRRRRECSKLHNELAI